jgi:DNA-binding MarR family transcriptional regulator
MASTPSIRRRESSRPETASPANEANVDLSIHYNIVAFMLRVTQVRLFQLYYKQDRMARHGLTTGAFTALLAIRQNPGIRRGTLADIMATQRPNMTKLLNDLERRGFIRRKQGEDDRRASGIFLTPAGRAKVDAMTGDAVKQDEIATSALGPSERRTLLRLLRKLSDGLRTLDAGSPNA